MSSEEEDTCLRSKQSPTAEQRPPHAVTIVYIRYERRFYVEGFGFRI